MQIPYMMVGTVGLMFLVGCDKPQQKPESRSETAAVPKTDLVKFEPVAKEEKKKKKHKSKVTPEDVRRIVEEVLRDYLENKPEVFVAALEKAMQKQQENKIHAIEKKATDVQAEFWKSKLVVGNKDAKLKLAYFFDPLDPVSQKVYREVLKPIAKDRSDVGFFMIPVSTFNGQDSEHPSSLVPTMALMLAVTQDVKKALVFWDKLQELTGEFSKTKMLKVAKEAGLDEKKIEKDLENPASQELVIENGKLAMQLGIPPQMPIMLVRFPDGHMELMSLLLKDKMVIALDAILKGKPWRPVVEASVIADMKAAEKMETVAPKTVAR